MHQFLSILFWNETLHVSDSSSVHHQEFFTAHTAMVYVIQFCWQLVSRIRTKQLDALISQIYPWNEILHVSDSSSVHHQEFFTIHTALVYVIQFCRQLASRIRINQLDALISQIYSWNETTCFGQFLCPSSGVFHCTQGNGICHTDLQTAREQDQDGTSWSCLQAVSKPV